MAFSRYVIILLAVAAVGAAGVVFWRFGGQNAKQPDTPRVEIPDRNADEAIPAETADAAATAAKDDGESESAAETKNPDAGNGAAAEPGEQPAAAITAGTEIRAPENETGADAAEDAERFVVTMDKNSLGDVAQSLFDAGFISDKNAFEAAYGAKNRIVVPGAYKLSKTMGAAQIAKALQAAPYMKWVIIPEGLRKEETVEILANFLGWDAAKKKEWLAATDAQKTGYTEGVYFPQTYLIPVAEAPADIAKRLIAKFNEEFAPYLPRFAQQNIKWTTGLTLASIVQREAVNRGHMPLIAGILWNRLEQDMALNVDATLQYARGNTPNGWWATISVADKQIDSPFNTYSNKGLPPHPICSPGVAAIEAVLDPAQTDCLYYLHGNDNATHCAKTYEEHLQNIERYLK